MCLKSLCHIPQDSVNCQINGVLGKAVAYTLNQWERRVGYVEI
jgi:hypothetical protein